jgi:hypothetical protein
VRVAISSHSANLSHHCGCASPSLLCPGTHTAQLMVDVCAREIGKRIMDQAQTAKPVLLALSLAAYDAPTVRAAVELVMAARVW